jgi:hypothetical protein
MPASYRIEELVEYQQRLAADPDFRPTMSNIIDTRGVTDVSVTPLGVRIVAAPSIFAPGSRRAIIANGTSPAYRDGEGYLRMFEGLRHQSGEDIKFFSTVEDVHGWLGLK